MTLCDAGLDADERGIEYGEQAISSVETVDDDPKAQPIDFRLLDMNLPNYGGRILSNASAPRNGMCRHSS
jgi:hypothetical protein